MDVQFGSVLSLFIESAGKGKAVVLMPSGEEDGPAPLPATRGARGTASAPPRCKPVRLLRPIRPCLQARGRRPPCLLRSTPPSPRIPAAALLRAWDRTVGVLDRILRCWKGPGL
eukprot:scaffold6_cov330-Pavlova_lutheri.AAC.9